MTTADTVDCTRLANGSFVEVDTTSRHYHIECLGGNSIRISGHPVICPDPVPAELNGSVDDKSQLKPGLIGCGMRLMFFVDDHRPVTTSKVIRVEVNEPVH